MRTIGNLVAQLLRVTARLLGCVLQRSMPHGPHGDRYVMAQLGAMQPCQDVLGCQWLVSEPAVARSLWIIRAKCLTLDKEL